MPTPPGTKRNNGKLQEHGHNCRHMQKTNALFVVDAFLATNLQTTKAACHDDVGHAIRRELPTTPLGAPFSQYFWRAFKFWENAKSCQELPITKSQRTQTSELQATIC